MSERWINHAEFLGDFADRIVDVMSTDGKSLGEYTEWLAESCFRHAERHCQEDFKNGVYAAPEVIHEPPVENEASDPRNRIVEVAEKVVGATQWADVSEDQISGDISTSGDRVKREEFDDSGDQVKRGDGYSGHKIVGSSWDEAKREPHVYSEVKTQEECARRFKDSEDERRNFTGIND